MWPNTNTNICYSNDIRILFEYRIIRSPLIWDPIWDPYDIPFASFMLIIKRMAKTIVHIQELFLFLYFLTQQIKIKLSFTEVPWTKESLATKFCNAILNLVIFSCFRAFFMLLHFEQYDCATQLQSFMLWLQNMASAAFCCRFLITTFIISGPRLLPTIQ